VLVGNVHFESSRLRVVIQFVNARTEMLIWSDIHTYEFTRTNLFEIEDLIVSRVMMLMRKMVRNLSQSLIRYPAKKTNSDGSSMEVPGIQNCF
jgi:hypothetical protein